MNLGNKANIMPLVYTNQVSFWIQKTNVRAQKIDGLLLKTFGIVITNFQIIDQFDKT